MLDFFKENFLLLVKKDEGACFFVFLVNEEKDNDEKKLSIDTEKSIERALMKYKEFLLKKRIKNVIIVGVGMEEIDRVVFRKVYKDYQWMKILSKKEKERKVFRSF